MLPQPHVYGRKCHWRPRAKGPLAGMRHPRSSISTYALKHGVGVPHSSCQSLSIGSSLYFSSFAYAFALFIWWLDRQLQLSIWVIFILWSWKDIWWVFECFFSYGVCKCEVPLATSGYGQDHQSEWFYPSSDWSYLSSPNFHLHGYQTTLFCLENLKKEEK